MVSKVACVFAIILITAVSVNGHILAHSSQHVSQHQSHGHVVYILKHGIHHGHEHSHTDIDYHAHPKYDFGYEVHDPHTGDFKSHHEDRDGDVVKGYYELKEPDGSIRRVEYHADKHSGFHATVKHSTHHIVPKHHHHHL